MWEVVWDIILGIKIRGLAYTAHNLNYPLMQQSSKHRLLHAPHSSFALHH